MSGRALLLIALAGALGASSLRAQEPDTARVVDPRAQEQERERPRPPQDTTRAVQDTLAPARPAYVPPRFALSLTVGTIGIGTLQAQPALAERVTGAGAVTDSVLLARSVEADRGLAVGASALWSLGPRWAVRVGAELGRATLGSTYEGEDDLYVDAANQLAAEDEVDATMLALEAAVRMRLPSSRRAQPYVEVGAFTTRWSTDEDRPGIPLAEGVQRVGAHAAVGAVIPLWGALSATVQATDRVYRTPLDAAPGGTAGPAGSTLAVTLLAPGEAAYADEEYTLVNSLQLDLGLRFTAGSAAVPPPDPAGAPVSTSPTGR
jgi:hypothetical protein